MSIYKNFNLFIELLKKCKKRDGYLANSNIVLDRGEEI